jgi:hypothetical protein
LVEVRRHAPVVALVGLSLLAAPAAASGAKGAHAVTPLAIKRCVHDQHRASCLHDLGQLRPRINDIGDCLHGKDRLRCLERLLIAPPPPERIVDTYPSVPASVTRVQQPSFSADGSRIIAGARSTQFSGQQVVSFRDDGSDFRCLTCAARSGQALGKPYAFSDRRRIMVRVGEQGVLSTAHHAVVECRPSVLNCVQTSVLPIEVPAASDPNLDQDQREFRIAPDSRHVAFSQVRSTRSGQQIGIGIVGRLVRGPASYTVKKPRVVAVDGEIKSFSPNGQSIYFARFTGAFDANNPDDVQISLHNGHQRRAVYATDWDEDIAAGPTSFRKRRWEVVGSARGTGELETVGRLHRALEIEYGTSALNFVTFIRPESAEPWLVDQYEARGPYIGQPLAPGAITAGWDSQPTFRWNPQGNKITFWQAQIGGAHSTRVVVAHLLDRKPIKAAPGRGFATPTPTWAPRLAGFVPPVRRKPHSRRGRFSGRLTVSLSRSQIPGWASLLTVHYKHFSDRRGLVFNGTETSYFNPAGGPYGTPCLYSADVRISGRHHGSLQATNVKIGAPTQTMSGPIESSLDGHRLVLGPLNF